MPLWILRPGPKTLPHLAKGDFSDQERVSLSADSAEWHQSHDPQPSPVTAGGFA